MKLTTFCFSPTGTSRKNMMAVVKGLGMSNVTHCDYTYYNIESGEDLDRQLSSDDLALFSVPVYGGLVAPTALQRMDKVKGNRTPAILMVTYGNRDFEKALIQLEEFVRKRGFLPVAAAAMVGEHSYSNSRFPIAAGRPDAKDLASATEFGQRLRREKLSPLGFLDIGNVDLPLTISTKRMSKVKTPLLNMLRFVWFVLGYRRKQKGNPVKLYPSASPDACSHCGVCVGLCPTRAIALGSEEVTDATRCIRCCACVKGCPTEARTFESPFAKSLSENFQMRREPLYIL